MIELLIAAVNYKTEKETIEFVTQVSRQTAINKTAIVIVNNKLSDNYAQNFEEQLKQINPAILYCEPNGNLGYLNGCLYGIDQYAANNRLPRWLTITNTDILLPDKDVLDQLLSKQYDDDIWVVAPAVKNANGNYHNPHYEERISLRQINRIIRIFGLPPLRALYQKLSGLKKRTRTIKKDSRYVYSAHGCIFFIRDSLYKHMNGEKYPLLLYGEESYIAEIVLAADKKCYYDSRLDMIHAEFAATGKLNQNKKAKFIVESLKYIKKRFYLS